VCYECDYGYSAHFSFRSSQFTWILKILSDTILEHDTDCEKRTPSLKKDNAATHTVHEFMCVLYFSRAKFFTQLKNRHKTYIFSRSSLVWNALDLLTSCNLGSPLFVSQHGQNIYLLQNRLDRLWGPHSQSFMLGVPKVKRVRREVNHSHPPTADVKNKWSYTSTSLYTFIAWRGKNLPLHFT
jgi:hypothetical protein